MEAISVSLLIFTVYGFSLLAYYALRKSELKTVRIVYINLIIMYALCLAAFSLLPINLPQTYKLNYIFFAKFVNAADTAEFMTYVGYSTFAVVIFIPMGVFMGMYCKLKAINHEILYSVMLGLLVSLTIEVSQIYLPFNRICDVDEILFNVLGTFIGAAVFYSASRRRTMKNILRSILYY